MGIYCTLRREGCTQQMAEYEIVSEDQSADTVTVRLSNPSWTQSTTPFTTSAANVAVVWGVDDFGNLVQDPEQVERLELAYPALM